MFQSGSFFACGDGVHMPSIRTSTGGRHIRSVTTPADGSTAIQSRGEPSEARRSSQPSREGSRKLKRRLTELSETLSFSDDVVCTRSPHTLPYTKVKGRLNTIFQLDASKLELPGASTRYRRLEPPTGRLHYRGGPRRHLCRLHDPAEEGVPVPRGGRRRSGKLRKTGEEGQSIHLQTSTSDARMDSLYGTSRYEPRFHSHSCPEGLRTVPPSVSVLWEEHTLCRLSDETARRFVEGHPRERDRERLGAILEQNRSRGDQHARSLEPQPSMIADGNSKRDDVFELSQEQLQAGKDSSLVSRDFLTALEEGARPIHQRGGDTRTIVLNNDARFEKDVQSVYPQQPMDWCRTEDVGGAAPPTAGLGRSVVKGGVRWTGLPRPAKTPEELQWVCQQVQGLDVGTAGCSDDHPTAVGKKEVLFHTTSIVSNSTRTELFNIVHEWGQRWHIHITPQDITEASILKEMTKFSDNSKMSAIVALAVLAEKYPHLSSPDSSSHREEDKRDIGLCPELIVRLSPLLGEETEHVRVPAAIVLHCLGREDPKSEGVLLAAVGSQSVSERWASVQCLAVGGVASAPVVAELIAQLVSGHDHRRRERAAELLARLSSKTSLVHAMLAEWLNSRSWRERMAVCQMLPRLHGGINKDQSAKLLVLAWEDPSPEVRHVAAQALGRTGQGKLIHNELKRRLSDCSETVRLDALRKLHALHLMTSQLLPEFLTCLSADHVTIKIEAIEIAGLLKLKERQVQQALQKLLQDDSWKVKAHALRALGEIGCCDDHLLNQLLWMVRFEKAPGVRAETCHTIATLGLREERVLQTLKDILTVDDDPLVLREVTLALGQLGSDTRREDDMLETVCSEVKRLGTQAAITQDILQMERKSIADYVIEERPMALSSTRDYLDENYRRRRFPDRRSSCLPAIPADYHSTALPDRKDGAPLRRSWTPDRATIDRQLEAMRKRCSQTAIS